MNSKRSRLFLLVAAIGILGGCASKPWQRSQNGSAAGDKSADASALLPKKNVVSVQVVKKALLGKSFMPGGALAQYRRGKVAYEIFLSELPTPTDSAIALARWEDTLKDPELVKSMSAYYGVDAGRPVYVFARGQWVAGIAGLSEKDADQQARMLAQRL